MPKIQLVETYISPNLAQLLNANRLSPPVRVSELPQEEFRRRVKAAVFMAESVDITISEKDKNTMLNPPRTDRHYGVTIYEDVIFRIGEIAGANFVEQLNNIPEDLFRDEPAGLVSPQSGV